MLESSPKIGMFKRKQKLNFSKASYSLSILNFQGVLHVKPISLAGSSHPCIPAPGDVGDPNHISAAKDAQLLEFEGWWDNNNKAHEILYMPYISPLNPTTHRIIFRRFLTPMFLYSIRPY